jgi:putative methionine-R-sulfoxide reductase with GAF domain
MTNEIQRKQADPENTEQLYMQTVLYIILFASFFLTGAITIAGLLLEMQYIEIGTLIALVYSAIMLWFTYHRELWVPRLLVPSIAYAAATYICLMNNGIRDIAMFVYPITMVLAGMLIGEKGIILYTAVVILTVSGIGYADITGRISSPLSQYNNIQNIIILDALFIIVGAILYVTINNLNINLLRVQHSKVESTQRYLELQTIRASLEEQVAEHTSNALHAQKEAEKANRTLEKRMWQYAGVARLSEMMRGEQNVTTLAQNIIRGLCEYLDTPIGALFLLEGNALNLAGGYAYPLDDENTPISFAIGEGVVGQAAQERRMIRINDVPTNYISITSGLGKASARHILVVPFIEDNHVGGVIEIGSFAELFPDQIQFIESVLKDIAIAFSTAQARTRIDELLRESQQMAEELQAQEEELRAANEELEVQTERLRESYAKLERQADEEVS